jgi:hypothetical protein
LEPFGLLVFLLLLHASFEISLFIFYWKLAMVFFFITHGLSFHFYLYSVREENTFHLENLDKSFFVCCLLQFCYTIPNVCKSLSLVVVHSNVQPRLLRCVAKIASNFAPNNEQFFSSFPFVHNMFHSSSQWVPISSPIF